MDEHIQIKTDSIDNMPTHVLYLNPNGYKMVFSEANKVIFIIKILRSP